MAGTKRINKICEDCGAVLENVAPMRKYCYACAKKRAKEKTAIWREEHRGGKTGKQIASPVHNSNEKYCNGCFYWGGENENSRCCNYIFYEGHRRPCPPGKDCTVKKSKRKSRKRFDKVVGEIV